MTSPWLRGDPIWFSVELAAESLADGSLSATGFADLLLARADALAHLNPLIARNPDRVRASARTADDRRRAGPLQRLLDGVPFVVDDMIHTEELPTTAGTPALVDHFPRRDATAVERLRSSGGILLGKSNIHELSLGVTGNNALIGPARNPYNPDHVAGSSGGTAIAVAAGIAPFGLVTDTGGSARGSAALCGCVGFRPTHGRYPGDGVIPISSTRDSLGVIARSVADVALVDRVITGERGVTQLPDLSGLRLAVPTGYFYDGLDPEVAALTDAVLDQLRQAGCVLIERPMADPEAIASAERAAGTPIAFFELAHQLPAYLMRECGPTLETLCNAVASPDVRHLLHRVLREPVDQDRYRLAMRKLRPALRHLFADYFGTANAVAMLVPTLPVIAPRVGEDDTMVGPTGRLPVFDTLSRNTSAASIAGIPALSLPIGLTASGLPVGLELSGLLGADTQLLAVGRAIEAILPRLQHPSID